MRGRVGYPKSHYITRYKVLNWAVNLPHRGLAKSSTRGHATGEVNYQILQGLRDRPLFFWSGGVGQFPKKYPARQKLLKKIVQGEPEEK